MHQLCTPLNDSAYFLLCSHSALLIKAMQFYAYRTVELVISKHALAPQLQS